jgi:hypothetical protein
LEVVLRLSVNIKWSEVDVFVGNIINRSGRTKMRNYISHCKLQNPPKQLTCNMVVLLWPLSGDPVQGIIQCELKEFPKFSIPCCVWELDWKFEMLG